MGIRRGSHCMAAGVLYSALILFGPAATAAPAVLQRGYTQGVTGSNSAETVLTPTNVTASTFGRIFSLPVDSAIFAQPLYVPGLSIPGQGIHNVLYVATMADSIFAFDADVPGAPLWSVNYASLLKAAPVPIVRYVNSDSFNLAGPVGIESTPVIDATTSTMYFVSNTLEAGAVVFRLHAVDITTGAEKLGGPVEINGTFTAGGKTLTFTPALENQRVSLVIAKNQIIVAFSSHEDYYQYYGWMMAYDKTSLAQTGIFCPTPTDDHGGAFWQSGRPPAVDSSGFVYAYVGNAFAVGNNSTWDGVNNFTESAVKLDPGQGLKLVDYFTPANYQSLDKNDQDLSSSGPTLIPGTNLLFGGGKDGVIYLLNTQNLGKLRANDAGAAQNFQGAAGEIRGGVAFWNRSTSAGGPLAFNWATRDALKAFSFSGSTFATTPVAQYAPSINLYPGGELAVSSNGDSAGIVWALINTQGDADHRVPPGGLIALNAANVNQLLWSSTTNAPRDDFGLLAKWVPPLVVNGKVYVGTASNQIVVYGVLPATGTTVTAWPAAQTALGGTASFTLAALSAAGVGQVATWSVAGLPTGAAGSFTADSQGQTVLRVTPGQSTPPGSYSVLVTADVNGLLTTQPVLVRIAPTAFISAVTASADSFETGNEPAKAIDGDGATFWHTLYGTSTPLYPHQITLDLGAQQPVSGISYLPRQDGCINGTALQYEIHLSSDGVNFTEITGGSFDYGPAWHAYNCGGVSFLLPKRMTIAFPQTTARYVQLVVLGSVIDGDPWASAAEVQVFAATASATQPQSITFNSIATQVAGTALSLNATTSSGLPVSYSTLTPATCVLSGSALSSAAAGTCTVTASQAGNAAYTAATPVTRSFAISVATGSGQGLPTASVNCASENGTCTIAAPSGITTTMYYGAGTRFVFKRGVTGSVACTNAVFGDPDVGVVKGCYLVFMPPAATVQCAVENGTCAASSAATVYYGAGGGFAMKPASGAVSCNNGTFGDPDYGVVKACYR